MTFHEKSSSFTNILVLFLKLNPCLISRRQVVLTSQSQLLIKILYRQLHLATRNKAGRYSIWEKYKIKILVKEDDLFQTIHIFATLILLLKIWKRNFCPWVFGPWEKIYYTYIWGAAWNQFSVIVVNYLLFHHPSIKAFDDLCISSKAI